MTKTTPTRSKPSQLAKFKDAARGAGSDEDEKRWEERLKKVAKRKLDEDATD